MAAGIVTEKSPPDGDPRPLCAWVYAGSHNLSGAAWGKVEEEHLETDGRAEASCEFVLMSYEIGVLLAPPKPQRMALPWVSPAERCEHPLRTPLCMHYKRCRRWAGAARG